jgi:hypothetical protein
MEKQISDAEVLVRKFENECAVGRDLWDGLSLWQHALLARLIAEHVAAKVADAVAHGVDDGEPSVPVSLQEVEAAARAIWGCSFDPSESASEDWRAYIPHAYAALSAAPRQAEGEKEAQIGQLEGLVIILRQALEVIANPNNARLDAGAAAVARALQGVASAALSIPLPGDGEIRAFGASDAADYGGTG